MDCNGKKKKNTPPTHSLDVRKCVAFWEFIRVPLPENVSDAAAGKNLQAASAHPHPEGELWSGDRYGGTSMMLSNLHRPKNNLSRAPSSADGRKRGNQRDWSCCWGSFHAPLPCNFQGQKRHVSARAAPKTSAERMKRRLDYYYYFWFTANSRDGRKHSSKPSQFFS